MSISRKTRDKSERYERGQAVATPTTGHTQRRPSKLNGQCVLVAMRRKGSGGEHTELRLRWKPQKNAAGKGCGRRVRANLRKERRRRNTFRVGHIQTPQMPSCHNRLLPSALLLPSCRLSCPYSHNRLCLSPSSSSYSPTSLHCFPLFFRHHPALPGVSAPLFALLASHASSVATL